MLKNIKKFLEERRRLVRQRRQQVIGEASSGGASSLSEVEPQQEEDNGDPSRYSEIPPQVAEPQLGEPAVPTVWGKLKWYNPEKRYGFVELADGSGDAFLHVSGLAGLRIVALQPGVPLECRTAPANRGLQVREEIPIRGPGFGRRYCRTVPTRGPAFRRTISEQRCFVSLPLSFPENND